MGRGGHVLGNVERSRDEESLSEGQLAAFVNPTEFRERGLDDSVSFEKALHGEHVDTTRREKRVRRETFLKVPVEAFCKEGAALAAGFYTLCGYRA